MISLDIDPIEHKTIDQLILIVEQKEAILSSVEKKLRQVENQLKQERVARVENVKQMEAEEEFITIKLLKRSEQIKHEKDELLRQVEQEEDYITNVHQKKLQKLQEDKINLENKLETEEEFFVNKLQIQLEQLVAEKNNLEHQLEEEPSMFEVRKLRLELDNLRKIKEQEIKSLQIENINLHQTLSIWKLQLEKLSTEKLQLERDNTSELEFNTKLHTALEPAGPNSKKQKNNRSNYLKKGWLNTQQEGTEEHREQYIILTPEVLLGFQHENIEQIPDEAVLTSIGIDKIEKVHVQEEELSITLKNGRTNTFRGLDINSWCSIISSLLPS